MVVLSVCLCSKAKNALVYGGCLSGEYHNALIERYDTTSSHVPFKRAPLNWESEPHLVQGSLGSQVCLQKKSISVGSPFLYSSPMCPTQTYRLCATTAQMYALHAARKHWADSNSPANISPRPEVTREH